MSALTRVPLLPAALLLASALLATACTPGNEDPDEPDPTADETEAEHAELPVEREGTSGWNREYESDLRVDEIVNHSDRSVVRMTVFPKGDEEGDLVYAADAFAAGETGDASTAPVWVDLIDPVGQKIYRTTSDDDGFAGSALPGYTVDGATYRIEAHYPALPESLERISLSVPGTQGVFTGLPVDQDGGTWDADAAPADEAPSHHDTRPGDEIVAPVEAREVTGEGVDLHSVVESTEVVRERSTTEQSIELDADVLFEFDESELTDEAVEALDDVVEETRAEADPELPPISVVGHTDGVGDDDYNQPLSEDRAEAVKDYLEDELGTDYEYEAEGLGATRPVAEEGGDDDEEARARNRRVQVSYNILQEEETEDSSEEGSVTDGQGEAVAGPAPYLERDEETVATADATGPSGHEYDLDVHALRRDGAFAVASVTVTQQDDRRITRRSGGSFSDNENLGGRFSSFGLVDPDTGDVYRSVRIGDPGEDGDSAYLEPFGFPFRYDPGRPNTVDLYFPAPPEGTESVDLEAGIFGTLEDVPLT